MIDRPYQKVRGVYLPSIKIQFINSINQSKKLFKYCLLDTGGGVTVIPYFLINELLLLPSDQEEIVTIEGVTKKRLICVPYIITFSFDNQNFYDSVVYYSYELDLDEIIIGRNILNRFSVRFDGINKRIIINS